MTEPDDWNFWDALTNANPDWWDSEDDEDESDGEEEEPDD